MKTAYNSVNFHEIAFQFPIMKGLGFGFSLSPYSNVGYNMYNDDMSSDAMGNVGRVRYQYYGEGDVTEVKAGVGWRPFKHLSVGVAMLYYWGDIKRNYNAVPMDVITGSGEYSSTTGIDTYDVSKIKAQFGLQWIAIMNSKRALTFGATYDIGGALKPDMVKYVYVDNMLTSVVRDEVDKALPLRLPRQVAAGVFYQTQRIRAGFDWGYQNWGDENANYLESGSKGVKVAYNNTHTVKAGFEITPRPIDVRNYLNRMSYRLGFRYGDYYQTFAGSKIAQYAVTAGVGFPVKAVRPLVDRRRIRIRHARPEDEDRHDRQQAGGAGEAELLQAVARTQHVRRGPLVHPIQVRVTAARIWNEIHIRNCYKN